MPMYDYFCGKCNLTIQRFRHTEHRHDQQGCPGCGHAMKFVEFPQDSATPEGRPDLKDPFRKI